MWAIVFLTLFFCLMTGIGIWGMRKTTTLGDFFLGGRSVGPWVSAIAYGTSYFSAVLFIGFAGKLGWVFGMNVLWIAAGNTLFGSLLAWLILGRRTRRMTQKLDVMTMPEFFEERFNAKHMKMIAAVIIFVFLLPYSASVYTGLGYLFKVNFNVSFETAVIFMSVITGVYLILGGYFAITMNDFIQGIIMLVGSLVMIALLAGEKKGFGPLLDSIRTGYAAHMPLGKRPPLLFLGCLVFMTSFGTWGLPQMVQKFYAIKDEKQISRAALATTLFALVVVFAAYFNGAITHAFFDKLPLTESGGPAFDQLIPSMLHAHLPEPLMALIMLLILSASMSTLSSLILVSSSSVAIDLYKGHVNPNISKESSVTMMRFLSGVFIILSCLISLYRFEVIVTLMSLSWGAVAGAFMAPYIYGLYWKRTTRLGALSGMYSGLGLMLGSVLILCMHFDVPLKTASVYAAVLAMTVPFAIVPLVSFASTPPADATIRKAFG